MRVTVSTHTSEAPSATSDTPAADRLGGTGVAGGGQRDEDGEQDGGAFFGQRSDGGPDLGPAARVEAGGRLVQEQHPRGHGQAGGGGKRCFGLAKGASGLAEEIGDGGDGGLDGPLADVTEAHDQGG